MDEGIEGRDRIFNDQLARTGAGYFDYYLLHSVEDGANYEGYVKYDCFNWAKKKKEEGLIKHFGFSFHGTPELLDKILSEHPEVEIVQIQMNYADWDNPLIQSGRLYEVLRKYNMPFLVMEPVKGGSLASAGKDETCSSGCIDCVLGTPLCGFPPGCCNRALRYVKRGTDGG